MSILDKIKNCKDFKYLAFGKNTDMIPYDDNVIAANLAELNNRCIYKGYCKAIEKIAYDITIDELRNGQLKNEEIIEMYQKYKKNESEKLGTVLFITVNPAPSDTTLPDLIKCINTFNKKKWVLKNLYVIEQRGSEINNIHGIHCHMIVWRQDGKKAHEIVRETQNTFKHLIGNEKHCRIDNCKDLENRVEYITGDKKCPEKQKKQIIDKEYRILNNLENLYTYEKKNTT